MDQTRVSHTYLGRRYRGSPVYGRRGGRRSLTHRPQGTNRSRYVPKRPSSSQNNPAIVIVIIIFITVVVIIPLAGQAPGGITEIIVISAIFLIFGSPFFLRVIKKYDSSSKSRHRYAGRSQNRYRRTGNYTTRSQPRTLSPYEGETSTQRVIKKSTIKRKCTGCGFPFEKEDLFCVKCGARLKKSATLTREVTCIYCGSLVEKGACLSCGKETMTCEICKKVIKLGDVVSECKHCKSIFHQAHLRETVKIFGKCPMCTGRLIDDDISIKVLKKENIFSPLSTGSSF